MTLPDKIKVLEVLQKELLQRDKTLVSELETLRNDLASDTKSTAGDKHETSRAMNQLEQERITKHLSLVREQATVVGKINTSTEHHLIGFGSLVSTNTGTYFISIGIGIISLDDHPIFCIGLDAPISKFLQGKTKGKYHWNGKWIEILGIK